jgi:hypothetical protein
LAVLERIAYFQNRRDEVPNQELARDLAESRNKPGIQEIAQNLNHKNSNVQSDCLKVLYEIGYLAPDLIADYVDDFLNLLRHKNNRMVWGGMIALGTIANIKAKEIWEQRELVIETIEKGTLITVVWGVKTLALVAAADDEYRVRLFPILLKTLQTCLARDVPMHAESSLCAVNAGNRNEFLAVLESRKPELTPSQLTRLKKILKQL